MKKILLTTALLGLAACGGTSIDMDLDQQDDLSSSNGVVSTSGGNATPVSQNQDQSFGRILNNVRIGNGASAVTYDSRLDAAAQAHADDMVVRGYFSHTSPEGDEVYERIVLQGYQPIAWGENLAGGQQSEAEALEAWENSAPHDLMMNAESLEEFGLGVAGTGSDIRWVLVMATEG
jgi:uncharacterized protein YkwD